MKYLHPAFTFSLMILIALVVSCAGVITKTPAQTEFDLGLSLFNRGHYERSIPHFERATEYEPEFGRAYLYLARSYINLGRWREALQPLRTAFRLSPEESRKEISEIIMDAVIQSQIDPDAQLQFQDILREK